MFSYYYYSKYIRGSQRVHLQCQQRWWFIRPPNCLSSVGTLFIYNKKKTSKSIQKSAAAEPFIGSFHDAWPAWGAINGTCAGAMSHWGLYRCEIKLMYCSLIRNLIINHRSHKTEKLWPSHTNTHTCLPAGAHLHSPEVL